MRIPKAPLSPEKLASKELRSRISTAFKALRRLGFTATLKDTKHKGYADEDLSIRSYFDHCLLSYPMLSKDCENKSFHRVPVTFLHNSVRACLETAGIKVEWDGESVHSMKLSLPKQRKA